MHPRYCALASAFLIAGCAQYSEVAHVRPHLASPPGTGPLADAEQHIARALREERGNPNLALGDCLFALQQTTRELERDPRNPIAVRDYGYGIARLFQIIHDQHLDPWNAPLTVPSSDRGDFVLTHKPDPRSEWNPARYEFTPADQYDVRGQYVTERTIRPGIGAAIVAVEREENANARQDFAPSRLFYSVSVVARFKGNRCELEFLDPLDDETVTFNGRTLPLAADFTVPLAVMLEQTDPKKHELSRLVNPDKFAHTSAIERLQPFSPNKTVVLVIHGLMDSQATWTPMINTLRGDPEIRKNYQFWFYSYPSGYPYPYTASILREELNRVEQRYPRLKPMVVIGHSMGGCITRALLTDSGGDNLWQKIFGRSPNQTPLSAKTREYFEQELIFRPRDEIGRAIFIAAPLRGSELASGGIYKMLSKLFISDPQISDAATEEMLKATAHIREEELKPKRRANSVDSLSPKSRFVNAINTFPMRSGVRYDTIIGDRGRGDSPNSSDGIVAYWSSHMKGAASEHIVPSDHSVHQNPQAIGEVLRLLKKNAR